MASLWFSSIAICFLFLTSSCQRTLSVKCWNCDSRDDRYCKVFDENQMKPSRLEECSNECAVYSRQIDGKRYIERSCIDDLPITKEECLQKKLDIECCAICSTDGCNGPTDECSTASIFVQTNPLILTSIAIAYSNI